MKRTLEIYEHSIEDGKHSLKKLPSKPRIIPHVGIDEARKSAVVMVEELGYRLKSISFLTNGNLKAVVHKSKEHPVHVIAGRVYRRPPSSKPKR